MYQWHALISRALYRIFFIGALCASFYLLFSVPAEAPAGMINDKVAHGITFFFLTLFISRAWPERYGSEVLLLMITLGLFTELVQYFLPWRSFSVADWLADIAGILCYHCLHLIRRRFVEVKRMDDHVQT